MVKLTWKDKLRKLVGLGLTDETTLAIAKEEADKKQRAIAAEKARLEAAAAAKALVEKLETTKVAKPKKKTEGLAKKTTSTKKKAATPKKKAASTKKKSSK